MMYCAEIKKGTEEGWNDNYQQRRTALQKSAPLTGQYKSLFLNATARNYFFTTIAQLWMDIHEQE